MGRIKNRQNNRWSVFRIIFRGILIPFLKTNPFLHHQKKNSETFINFFKKYLEIILQQNLKTGEGRFTYL